MQITIIAFLCHPSLCCMPCLRVLLSTFFISLTVPFFLCSSFKYFPVLSYFTKSPCSLSCIQRAHQIPSCQFPRHVVSLPHHREPVSTPVWTLCNIFFLLLPPLNACLGLHTLPLLHFQSHPTDHYAMLSSCSHGFGFSTQFVDFWILLYHFILHLVLSLLIIGWHLPSILSLKFFGSLNILLQNIWFSLFLFFLSLSLLLSTCLSMSLCLVTSCFILLTSWLISVVFHFASPILLMWLVSAFSLFCPTHVAFAWLASDLSESFVSLFLFCYSDCLLICFCMFSLLVFSMLVLCLLGSVFFSRSLSLSWDDIFVC